MTRDARVEAAIAHWAPRFLSNGVLLQDFHEVTAGLERRDDWCRAWSARAAVHEALGHEALGKGQGLTEGEHLTRAGVYYHVANNRPYRYPPQTADWMAERIDAADQ